MPWETKCCKHLGIISKFSKYEMLIQTQCQGTGQVLNRAEKTLFSFRKVVIFFEFLWSLQWLLLLSFPPPTSVLTSLHRSNLRRGVKEKKHYSNSSLKFHPHPVLTLSLLTNLPKRTELASSLCSPGHLSTRRYLTPCFPDVIGSKTICSFLMSQNQPLLHEK